MSSRSGSKEFTVKRTLSQVVELFKPKTIKRYRDTQHNTHTHTQQDLQYIHLYYILKDIRLYLCSNCDL